MLLVRLPYGATQQFFGDYPMLILQGLSDLQNQQDAYIADILKDRVKNFLLLEKQNFPKSPVRDEHTAAQPSEAAAPVRGPLFLWLESPHHSMKTAGWASAGKSAGPGAELAERTH